MLCLCLSGGLQTGIRKSNLKVLYVGGSPDVDYVGNRPDSAVLAQSSAKRMASFDKMLKRYFRKVTVIPAQAYRRWTVGRLLSCRALWKGIVQAA